MIPQNFKDVISASENANLWQIISMLLFMLFFVGVVFLVFKKPKKYYEEDANLPLSEDHPEDTFKF